MTTYAGSHYPTMSAAARACAEDMLPDCRVIGADERPTNVARDLQDRCTQQLRQAGLPVAPEGEDVFAWLTAVREAIEARIRNHRTAARMAALGTPAEVRPGQRWWLHDRAFVLADVKAGVAESADGWSIPVGELLSPMGGWRYLGEVKS